MKLKVKRMFLLIAMLCAMIGASANDYDFEVDGIYYKMISFSDLTCRVVKKSDTFKYYGDVVIPAQVKYGNKEITVVELQDGVFYKCGNLTGITIPNTISSLNNSFSECSKLEWVKFEDGETALECGRAFRDGCGNITKLYLGRNLSYINSAVPFDNKRKLKEITIGKYVTKIGFSAFEGCSSLTSVTIPSSVTEIGESAFSGCTGLTSVKIPNSVTVIKDYTFKECSGLTSVTIPNSVTEIGEMAFYGCTGLTNITTSSSLTKIGNFAFGECKGITSVIIPNSVTEIGCSAFSDCISLTSITIPNSVTKMRSGIFSGCSGLKSITIPNSVTEIESNSFAYCNSLTSISIPNSVSEIGWYVVRDCEALTSFYCFATTPPIINENYGTTFTTNQIMTLNVYVPKEALADYQKTDGWKDLWNLQGFDPTAVDGIEADEDNSPKAYYDLQGRKSDAPRRGLNIVKGKKILVK